MVSFRWIVLGALALALVGPMRAHGQDTADGEGAPDGGAEEPKDEGKKLPQYTRFFYAQPFVGYSWADGGALGGNDSNTPSALRLEGHGLTVGGALGFKIIVLQLGARAVYSFYEDYDLGGVMGDIGVRIPIPVFEPIIRVGLGYGWMNAKNTLGDLLSQNPDGFLLDIGLGFDIWAGSNITVGFDGALGFYFLARDGIDCLGTAGCEIDESHNAGALQLRLQLTIGFWA